MTCRSPLIVTRRDAAGRWRASCDACMDGSEPSFHKPKVEDWRRVHIAESRVAK